MIGEKSFKKEADF